MPRRPSTRPTLIYWLVDMRPSVLATHPAGYPFYCGKTVDTVAQRLRGHRKDALKHPDRKLTSRLFACGEHIRIVTVEVVPIDGDWAERERSWIRVLRFSFPDNANSADGGAGWVPSAEQRARMSHAQQNLVPWIMEPEEAERWRQHRTKVKAKRLEQKAVRARACAKIKAAAHAAKNAVRVSRGKNPIHFRSRPDRAALSVKFRAEQRAERLRLQNALKAKIISITC